MDNLNLKQWQEEIAQKQLEIENIQKTLIKESAFLGICEKLQFIKEHFDENSTIFIHIQYFRDKKCNGIMFLRGQKNKEYTLWDIDNIKNLGLNPFFNEISVCDENYDQIQLVISNKIDTEEYNKNIDIFIKRMLITDELVAEFKMFVLDKTLSNKNEINKNIRMKI